jgi:tetratricopeptide (TPR) repeat protein
MKREPLAPQGLEPPPEQVELLLAQVEGSAAFRGSRRHRALLRHLVERSLAGDFGALKESVLAVEVFGRPATRFDRRDDTIVRVETRRLRQRLDTYFRTEGRASPMRIELPVGSYVPVIALRDAAEPRFDATRRARDLVERGEYFLRLPLSQATLEQALERFDAALRDSPDWVPALVGAGRAWFNLAIAWYHEPAAAAAHAAEALRRALAIDDSQAVAHALLGAIEHQFERDWPAARRSFKRAVERAPENAFVHSAYGCHLMNRGEFDAAERELALARRLDPHYVNARIHMVNLRIGQRRFDDAQAEIDGMRDIAPRSMPAAGMSGLLALVRGQADEAIGHYRQACELAPGHAGCEASLAAALGAAGRIEEADALVARLAPGAVSPYVRAIVAVRCGREDEAFALLQQALDTADPNTVTLSSDPSFDALRTDPRWPRLVATLRTPRRDQ